MGGLGLCDYLGRRSHPVLVLAIVVPILDAAMFIDSVECDLSVTAEGIQNTPSVIQESLPRNIPRSQLPSWYLGILAIAVLSLDRKRATLNC